jgi:hypothetical protein
MRNKIVVASQIATSFTAAVLAQHLKSELLPAIPLVNSEVPTLVSLHESELMIFKSEHPLLM